MSFRKGLDAWKISCYSISPEHQAQIIAPYKPGELPTFRKFAKEMKRVHPDLKITTHEAINYEEYKFNRKSSENL